MPDRAHPTDAGLDLRAKVSMLIPAGGSRVFDTGVHVELPKDCAGLLVSKSGLNVNFDIVSTGLIDEGYRGSIRVKLHNLGKTSYMVHAKDKISQLVIIPVRYEPIEVVDQLTTETERGEAGFGSTGK